MKLNRLETHDRLVHFKQNQSAIIQEGANDCLFKNPLSLALQDHCPYIYIFAHPRTHDDGLTKRMLWQPRLTKPKAQENSYLFRAKSRSDIMEICWLIPAREMWKQYAKGNVTESDWVRWSIHQYIHRRDDLERPFVDDVDDLSAKKIYKMVAAEWDKEKSRSKLLDNLYLK